MQAPRDYHFHSLGHGVGYVKSNLACMKLLRLGQTFHVCLKLFDPSCYLLKIIHDSFHDFSVRDRKRGTTCVVTMFVD